MNGKEKSVYLAAFDEAAYKARKAARCVEFSRSQQERKKMAHRFLLQYRGYEDAANLCENRYMLSAFVAPEKEQMEILLYKFRVAQKKKEKVLKEKVDALQKLKDGESRIILWMIYIERKEPDEVAMLLDVSEEEVLKKEEVGLLRLEVPEDFCRDVKRREKM